MKERSRERTKVNNTCAPEPKHGTIQSFFNGTAKIKRKTVPCPICQKEVELQKINDHMDSQECVQEKSNSNRDEKSSVIDLTVCDSNENNVAQKRKSTEDHDFHKRFKTGDNNDANDDFLEDDEDDKVLAALKTPEKKNRHEEGKEERT